jgi:hypothetical protein
MNVKRNIAIALGVGAGAVWFAAAMTPSVPSRNISSAPAAIDKTGAALQQEVDRLRDRLRPDVSPRASVRNPFVFHGGPGRVAPASPSASAGAPAGGASPSKSQPAAFEPLLRLSGLAEDAGPDGPVRTAIISGAGQVFLVREGDPLTVEGVSYVVGVVSSTGVELRNAADGTTRRLVLP